MSIRGPDWIREYIGIPFKKDGYTREGCHCWGLVCLVQQEQFGRTLMRHDDFHYEDRRDAKRAAEAVEEYLPQVTMGWHTIAPSEVECGDVLMLRVMGRPIHTAVAVSHTHMLHQEDGCNSVCEEIFGLVWGERISSVWRCGELP